MTEIPMDDESRLSPAEIERRDMALLKEECDDAGTDYPEVLRQYIGRARGVVND